MIKDIDGKKATPRKKAKEIIEALLEGFLLDCEVDIYNDMTEKQAIAVKEQIVSINNSIKKRYL